MNGYGVCDLQQTVALQLIGLNDCLKGFDIVASLGLKHSDGLSFSAENNDDTGSQSHGQSFE